MKMFNNYSLFKYRNKYSRCHSEPFEESLFLKVLFIAKLFFKSIVIIWLDPFRMTSCMNDYYLPQILQI